MIAQATGPIQGKAVKGQAGGQGPVKRKTYLSAETISDLQAAYTWSEQRLSFSRTLRKEFIRQIVGANYSEDGAAAPVVVPFMEMAVQIFMRQLVAHSPQILVSTRYRDLMPNAAKLTQSGNALIREIDLGDSLKRWVMDALLWMGVMKVGVYQSAEVEILGFMHDIHQPYADPVSWDDFCYDMGARRMDQLTFAGDTIRIPYELALDSGLYDNKVLEEAGPTEPTLYNAQGDERAETLSAGSYARSDEYKRHINLVNVWLPLDNLICTFPEAEPHGARGWTTPAREVEWEGPEGGPYHFLTFEDVPDNIMPLSPCSVMYDMHIALNSIFRKLVRQAERQKTVGFTRAGKRKDGETIIHANDGEVHGIEDPNSFAEFKTGGPDGGNMAFFLQMKALFSVMNGNLEAMGGLAAQTDTVGQERIVAANVSKKIGEMQERFAGATKKVVTDLLWYLWNDPVREIPIQVPIPGGSGLTIPTSWGPLDREGDFLHYNFEIVTYSMQDRTPADRLNGLMRYVNGFLLPMQQMLAAQSLTIDFEALSREIAELEGIDSIERFLITSGPVEPWRRPLGAPPPNPPTAGTRVAGPPVGRPASLSPANDFLNAQAGQAGAGQAGAGQAGADRTGRGSAAVGFAG
jgi:hypothetical protein